jgi:hypothetical protein
MTPINQPARRPAHATAREARTRRSFVAVFASYIRELAAAGDTAPYPSGEAATSRSASTTYGSNWAPEQSRNSWSTSKRGRARR